MQTLIKSLHEAKQIVYGEVYLPGMLDAHGDMMTAEQVEKMAHNFCKKGRVQAIDVEHDKNESAADATIIEIFVARKGWEPFREGAMVIGAQLGNDLWDRVIKGELNGFSLDGYVQKEDVQIEMLIDDEITGQTEPLGLNGHSHTYKVLLGSDAQIKTGRTNENAGHYHDVLEYSVTGPARAAATGAIILDDDHTHRFNLLDNFE